MVSDIQDSSSSVCLLHKKLWSRFRFSETLLTTFFQVAFQTTERKTKFHKQVVWWSWNFFKLVYVTVIKYASFALSSVCSNTIKGIMNIVSVNNVMIIETVIPLPSFLSLLLLWWGETACFCGMGPLTGLCPGSPGFDSQWRFL